jgi:hypothetical protein
LQVGVITVAACIKKKSHRLATELVRLLHDAIAAGEAAPSCP